MKKCIRSLLMVLITVTLFFTTSPAFAENPIKIITEEGTIQAETSTLVSHGLTYFPVQFTANVLGVTDDNIFWDQKEQKMTMVKDDKTVEVKAESNILTINGTQVVMNIVPKMINRELMLHPAWVARAFDYNATWDGNSRTLSITKAPNYGNKIKLIVNGQNFQLETQPEVINYIIYFPVKDLANSLSINNDNILWNETEQKMILIKGDRTLEIQVGSNKLILNNNEFILDNIPKFINNKVMLPPSWITRAFGYNIVWKSDIFTVEITGTGTSPSTLTSDSTTIRNAQNTTTKSNNSITDTSTLSNNLEQRKTKCLAELKELETKLEKAKTNKTIKTLVKQEDGTWQNIYVVDPDAINKAQKLYDLKYKEYSLIK